MTIPLAEQGRRTAIQCAWVAGVFSAVVCLVLVFDYGRRLAEDPLNAAEFLKLKEQMAADPTNGRLKGELRERDQQLRQDYFRQREFAERGTWLLLGGLVVMAVSMKTATTLNRRLPMPVSRIGSADTESRMTEVARRAVAGLALVAVGTVIGLSVTLRSGIPVPDDSSAGVVPLAPDYPTDEEIALQWPRFRGPGGLGISAYDNIPTTWDAESGENILWKTPVPLEGNNSPVVWGKRVFLCAADEEHRQVFCFDADSGELLWDEELPGTPASTAEVPDVMADTGFSAPTIATDGRRAYAMFANGDVGAFDFSGKLVWSKSLGIPKNVYGHGASLAMYRDRLLIQFDQGERKDGLSALLALNGASGETVWSIPRKVPNSWPTPIVINCAGRDQIITGADPWVIAYDASDGSEIWRAKCLEADVGPSPVFADGVVYTVNEYPQLSAIKADGSGDVTESHVLWIGEDGLPDCASPLATGKYTILVDAYGYVTCYDGKAGDLLWEYELEDASVVSSPSLVGNHMYVFANEGQSWVIDIEAEEPAGDAEDAKQFRTVATGNLGEECVTSPAFQEGRIYIRGKEHLFCIGR